MRSLTTILTLLFLTCVVAVAQEVSLYDRDGKPVAYIDYDEDATIFLWKGTPVAFLESDRGELGVIGFNGKFLGWYEEGRLYDKKGYIVGAREDAVRGITHIEPIKGIQSITPIRPITPIAPLQPILSYQWSPVPLIDLLYAGKK